MKKDASSLRPSAAFAVLVSPTLCAGFALLVALFAAASAHAQGFYMLAKYQNFRQTSAAAVAPDPHAPFQVEIFATVNVGLTLPSGVVSPLRLRYDQRDEEFQFAPVYATKAAMDAAFPAGTYQMNGTGIPALTLSLPEGYSSATPQVTAVTNATWNATGFLVVNPTLETTISFTPFSDYAAAGAAGYLEARIVGFGGPNDRVETGIATVASFDLPVQSTPLTSLTIPANRLINGRLYRGTLEFMRAPTVDPTTITNGDVITALSKILTFYIQTQTTPTTTAAPTITNSPVSRTVGAGGSTTFSAPGTVPGAASSNNSTVWYKNGMEFDTSSPRVVRSPDGRTLTINQLTAADSGDYVVEVISPGGIVRSTPATLTIPVVAGIPRLTNLSILTSLASANDSFTVGYVVAGAGQKPLVIRSAGPSLAALGVTGELGDPKLELFVGASKTGENDQWGGDASLASAMAGVGAFPYSFPGSRDAAVAIAVSAGDNSVRVSSATTNPAGPDGLVGTPDDIRVSGAVLAEIYDATPSATFTATTPRLVNVSVLKNIGTGLTVGFVIGGGTERTVLIRAIGPTVGAAPFNVPGAVADPQLALFTGSIRLATNNDWAGTNALRAAFAQIGAFALPNNSRDAALLATLGPGNYTVQVTGVGNATGTALVEVYELP